MTAAETVETAVQEEDLLRAQIYRLLAKFLRAAPSADDLKLAADLSGDDSELGSALNSLARLSDKSAASAVNHEYHDLFIGVGRGELVPYGSYYLTGFLNEKPLAKLRNEMRELGIVRKEGVSDPEDHVAALCEMMSGLIAGDYGEPLSLARQKAFFDHHVGTWARYFFEDLEAAKSSMLYAAVGAVGKAFMDIEFAAFRMVETQA